MLSRTLYRACPDYGRGRGAAASAAMYARGTQNVTPADVKRLYKELMKAAMRISNPKLRLTAYDTIRYEFKARQYFTDELAIGESMTRGIADLDTLRDGRVHPFLYVDEDGHLKPPLIVDPNAPQTQYVGGPTLSLVFVAFFGIGGGFLYGIFQSLWQRGVFTTRGYLFDDTTRPSLHKGVPAQFQGHDMTGGWEHAPPTGVEITDFRNKVMSLREEEAKLEAELLDLEAKCYAKALEIAEEAPQA
eukprot:TRINITY_DN32027_c0_g1_i1.p1 TRINITY_DN32027_c0_g1~~TRINITY_DN32027_c0_g1_i1.p1  ORF type:complete len:246 (+),score=70.70 TRINITY_DN32027_c0_g1_i1:144-881(+)